MSKQQQLGHRSQEENVSTGGTAMKLGKENVTQGLLFVVVLSTTLLTVINSNDRAQVGSAKLVRDSGATASSQHDSPSKLHTLSPPDSPTADHWKFAKEKMRNERLVRLADYVEQLYGKPVEGLEWNEADKVKLIEFLVDRYESRYIAHAVVSEQAGATVGDFARLISLAESDVDREMLAYFGEQKYSQIRQMLELSGYLDRIHQIVEPLLDQAGVPLAAPQVLPLAAIFREVYGPPGNPATLPTRDRIEPQSGLTEFDRLTLKRASSILKPVQVAALQAALVLRNEDYSSRN